MGSDSPGEIDAPSNKDNSLAATIERFQFNAHLWQAFTADQLYKNGFGRRTFQLELDHEYDAQEYDDDKEKDKDNDPSDDSGTSTTIEEEG